MAATNTTGELVELTDRLDVIASRLCGMEPALQSLCDQSNNPAIGNQLEMIGGLSSYINNELCEIVSRLKKISAPA